MLLLGLLAGMPALASVPDGCTVASATLAPGDSILRRDRVVWHDPGPKRCKVPLGMDAGVCVRAAPLERDRGGDIRCLPSFVIIGIQKAATRELMAWLNAHPSLSNPGVELGYLNNNGCQSASLRRRSTENVLKIGGTFNREVCDRHGSKRSDPFFWRGYMDRFPPIPESAVAHTYTYEKTPGYFEMKQADIERLREMFPSMRLIVSFRDPTSRIYSWFNMVCRPKPLSSEQNLGKDWERGFIEILDGPHSGEIWATRPLTAGVLKGVTKTLPRGIHPKLVVGRGTRYAWRHVGCTPEVFERFVVRQTTGRPPRLAGMPETDADTGLPDDLSGAYDPIVRGQYADHLEVWHKVFPKGQILGVTMDEMFKYPIPTMQRIERFLGLPKYEWETVFNLTSVGTVTLKGHKAKVERDYKVDVLPMTNLTKQLLDEHYRPHNERLSIMLGGKPGSTLWGRLHR